VSNSIIWLLDKEQKQRLTAKGKQVTYSAGHTLFCQGDDAEQMFLVKKGKVSLFRLMPSGDEKLFKVFMSGELIAEMAMFMIPRVYPMTAKIEQESTLIAFSHQAITDIVMSSSELSMKVITYMSNRICNLMNTQDILTQVNANQRLIMRLAEIYKIQTHRDGKIALPVTKKLLATQLGMTPETLSRVIKRLKNEKLLEESDNNLIIMDIPLLCQSANLTPDLFE